MENEEKNSFKPLEPIKSSRFTPLFFWLVVFVFVGFATASALFFFFTNKTAKFSKSKSSRPAQSERLVPAPAPIVETIQPAIPQEPVVMESQKVKPLPSLALSGILFSEQGSVALINGRLVKEGSAIEGATLQKVHSDKVELIFEDKRITLRAR